MLLGKTCLEKRVKMRALRQEENGAAAATTIPAAISSDEITRNVPGSIIAFKSLDELPSWEIVIFQQPISISI